MRRTTISVLTILALAMALSCALWVTKAAADNESPISYHNGPVMTGTPDVYLIWYGSWSAFTGPNSADTQRILNNFLAEIGGSIHFQTNATYPGTNGTPTGVVIYGGQDTAITAHGTDLTRADIQTIVRESLGSGRLPADANGIYLVIASSDIASTETGFCAPTTPPEHGAFAWGPKQIRYGFIGNAARCPQVAAAQYFDANGSQLPSPNGNLAADAMVSTALHVLDTTVTDPYHDAWFDGFGLENADKCDGRFSHTRTAANGAKYNFSYGGETDKYLIQDNWINNYGGYCGQQNDAPPRPDNQTVQVNQDTAKAITLTGVDDNGDAMTFAIVAPPQHGTLTGSGANRTYTPASNYRGPDSFTFKANDGTLDSVSAATVSISVNTNAALDGFDPNANGLVRTVVVQPDGKILIGGDFTTLAPNGRLPVTRNYVARLNIDGTVDPTFNPSANSLVEAIALQPDGKIIIAGDFSAVAPNGGASITRSYAARFNANGTIDPTFDPHPNGPIHGVAVQADGGVVIGGEFTTFFANGAPTITRNRIARLNADGSLDPLFNPNANATVDTVAIQPDGRILIGGRFTTLALQVALGTTITRNYFARLNVDGTVDQSFDPNPNNIVGGIAIQPDGKVLLGGAFSALGPNDGSPIARDHLARMNVDGTLDTAFSPNPNSFVRSIVVQPDGKILIGGGFTSLAPNGVPSGFHKYIARLNPDGTLVPGLDPAPNDQVFAIAVQADGKIVVGGVFLSANSFGGQARNRIARLEPDGRVDQTLNINMVGSSISATAVQPDGKIIIGGTFTSVLGVARKNLARLNSDGTLDVNFNPTPNAYVTSIAVQPDGKILIGGFFTGLTPNGGASITRNRIARLNPDGTVDTAFDPNANDLVSVVALQADGKILLGGSFSALAPNGLASTPRNHIARLTSAGLIDPTFSPSLNLDLYTLAVQPDGKILIGGAFTGITGITGTTVLRNFIARLNSDGTVDLPFDPNASGGVMAFAIQPDGKIVVSGVFGSFNPNGTGSISRSYVARLNSDGTLDGAFDPRPDGWIGTTSLQADGKILLAGAFSALAANGGPSVARNYIARLNPNGTVDPAFDPGPDDAVGVITMQADGKILVGGSFANFGGQSRNLFVRLANDTPAIQNLAVNRTTVTWSRSGAEPNVSRVTFERSTDGVNYTFLGNGTPVGTNGDFTLAGQNLPVQQNLYIRARGLHHGGNSNASESITDSVRNVFLPPALHLAFAQQPTNAPENGPIAPPVTVQILDAANNQVNSTAAVTLGIGNNPASGTLSGTKTVAAVAGIATFNNLSIDKLGVGYTLNASATNMIGTASNSFNVTVNAPSAIVATAGSGQSAIINSQFANALQARVTDVNGNPVSGVTVTFSAPANGASGTFANNTTTTSGTSDNNGVAVSSALTANGLAGPYSISASINGGATATAFNLSNAKANQTISVTTHAPTSATYNSQFNVAATSSLGLPISFSSSGSCSNTSASFTMTSGTGNCTVKYDQAGDANHNAAPSVVETVSAQKAAQSITFDAIADKTFGDSDFALNASASSGLSVSLAASGNCSVNGGAVHLAGAGSCTITASQSGSSAYNAATDVARSFNIGKSGQTISFNTLPDKTFGDEDFSVSAATSSGLAVSLAASGQCTVVASSVHINGAGACTITASQPGDGNYAAAAEVQRSFQITRAAQTINLAPIADKTFGDADFAVSASASSGLTVSLAASGPCAISGSNVHLNGAGTCTVTASQSGDSNINAATDVARSFQIAKASTATEISFSTDGSNGRAGIFTATVTSAAGVPDGSVTFKINDAGKINGAGITSCTDINLSSGLAVCATSELPAGTYTVTAEYSGQVNFNASTATLTAGQTGSVFEFSQANYTGSERGGSVTITVKRTGDATAPASVDYVTDDGSVPSVAIPCSQVTGVASERCDYTRAEGTLQFAANETEKSFTVLVNDDSYVEGVETVALKLSSPGSGASLGAQTTAALQIIDDVIESSGNPVDDESAFVRQHYHDLLNREPDSDGLKFWTNNITSCESDEGCTERKRVDTSAAFFLSIEFQETGYLVERFYKSAYGDGVADSTFGGVHQLPVPIIRWREFVRDTQQIGRTVVVGNGAWQQQLEDQKQAFAREFVSRPRFTGSYPASLSASEFINRLNGNAGGVLTKPEIIQLEDVFGGPDESSADALKRAVVLRSIAENQTFHQREFNRAFVLMQYFGYLRRNPDDAQDTDYSGYDFWLRKLDQFGGNYINAEMVKAFVSSIEYRQRFGQ